MADGLHVCAQLVGAARVGAKAEPCGALGGAGDGDVLGLGWLGARILGLGRNDHLAVSDAGLHQGHLDDPLIGLHVADDEGPVGLLRPSLGEGARQPRRRRRRLAEQQHAGGVPVEPMHQPRPLQSFAPGAQEPVHVTGGLGPALHRKAAGLVQREDLLVLIDDQ